MPFCVIVGAGPGLGASIARCFLRHEHKVALVSRERGRLQEMARDLARDGDRVAGFAADAGNSAALTGALASARAWGGDIDVLIYNAAAMREVPASALSFDSFMADAAINLGGALTCVQAVLPGMRARRSGSILFTGGGLSLEPYPAWSALAAGKAALRSYAIALHKEVAPENVQVAVITVCGIIEPGSSFDPDVIAETYWDLHATPDGRTHLRPHRREDFLTKMTAAPYLPDARSDIWLTFMEGAIPDSDARDFAQRYAGYSLTGSTREEVFVFCRGPAGAGKTTYAEAQRRTWGDYATSADFGSFLVKKPSDGPREDLARLAGARLVTSVETRDGQRLAEGLVKLLTGGDTVPARRLYERTFEFVPQFKLLLASNYRPHARADDDGLWRRLRELPFPTARPRREDRDDSIKAFLTDPAQAGPAILAWAVEGCQRWLAKGLGEPEAVMQATAAYRRSQEPLAEFVADCCTLDPELSLPATQLREEYFERIRWEIDVLVQELAALATGGAAPTPSLPPSALLRLPETPLAVETACTPFAP